MLCDRWRALEEWEKLPSARTCHAQEDHLMPLLVVMGAAGEDKGTEVWKDEVLGGNAIFAHWGFGL